jgi:hypothetical protein
MAEHCTECSRLWQHYSEAADAHFVVVCQQVVGATLWKGSSALARLESLHRETYEIRRAARQAVVEHSATHSARPGGSAGDSEMRARPVGVEEPERRQIVRREESQDEAGILLWGSGLLLPAVA